ncbi:MAG: phenylalanine--tRNA ligase subunit alpha [Gammaproteobacteria bacterium]|nr:phenylalanine--tRNA ligase subunit alpha [Gammaproteobacteria bacterium]
MDQKAIDEINQANDLLSLEAVNTKYLGKKGLLTEQLKQLGQLDPEARREAGQKLNILKNKITEAISERKNYLNQKSVQDKLSQAGIDVTLPGRGYSEGNLHPITQSKQRIQDFFEKMGFSSVEGPEIEDDFHNFTALNIPENHPARASFDTFYFPDGRLLRTHTSPVQIRELKKRTPPIHIIAMGRVYRRDSDLTHTPMFHQLEVMAIDKGITFAHNKGMIQEFLTAFFEKELPVRFRPSYFPFTEPSAEVDMGCVACNQKGCRICKNSGWLEVMGCGMIHPNVLKNVDIDPEKYSGYAWGVGIDRLTMLRYGVNDLRLFFENDLRFLRQF